MGSLAGYSMVTSSGSIPKDQTYADHVLDYHCIVLDHDLLPYRMSVSIMSINCIRTNSVTVPSALFLLCK